MKFKLNNNFECFLVQEIGSNVLKAVSIVK